MLAVTDAAFEKSRESKFRKVNVVLFRLRTVHSSRLEVLPDILK